MYLSPSDDTASWVKGDCGGEDWEESRGMEEGALEESRAFFFGAVVEIGVLERKTLTAGVILAHLIKESSLRVISMG